jgi:transposase
MKSTAAVTTIAIDLAKNVFQLALADAAFRIVRPRRLKRAEFLAFWANQAVVHVVMEACGSAHHFGHWLSAMGHRVTLLPPQYVRPYVRRNKTDAADCAALLEALRASNLKPVPVKTEHQQGERRPLARHWRASS